MIDGTIWVGVAQTGRTIWYGVNNSPIQNLEDLVPSNLSNLTIENQSGFPTCFAAGTLIATPDGERKVEDLRIGDRILTACGAVVLVKWVGRQTVHRLFTPAERFRPVRIRAGALAEGVPHADLVVTADHGIMIGEIMVNAGALVNGTSIVRVPLEELAERVTYWHVETEGHAVILAAGAPAETYIDHASRRLFDNFAEYEALYGAETFDKAELPYARAMSFRQVPADVRALLTARAIAIGAEPAEDAIAAA